VQGCIFSQWSFIRWSYTVAVGIWGYSPTKHFTSPNLNLGDMVFLKLKPYVWLFYLSICMTVLLGYINWLLERWRLSYPIESSFQCPMVLRISILSCASSLVLIFIDDLSKTSLATTLVLITLVALPSLSSDSQQALNQNFVQNSIYSN